MGQESFQIMQLFYASMISRAIFTVGIFFMAWVALRVARSVSENQNLVGQIFSTIFGLVVCWFGLVQGSFTTWSTQSTAYQLSQLESISPTEQLFVDYFNVGLPNVSVVPDPLNGLFWLCILVFILVPTWQKK
tara:strand:- start:1164 stop:1562 length:399 start_codon:yes stop_codon:yes gene_type:complete